MELQDELLRLGKMAGASVRIISFMFIINYVVLLFLVLE